MNFAAKAWDKPVPLRVGRVFQYQRPKKTKQRKNRLDSYILILSEKKTERNTCACFGGVMRQPGDKALALHLRTASAIPPRGLLKFEDIEKFLAQFLEEINKSLNYI